MALLSQTERPSTVTLLESLLDAIVRLDGEALIMHVGEKPVRGVELYVDEHVARPPVVGPGGVVVAPAQC